jgi:hypothetical protein
MSQEGTESLPKNDFPTNSEVKQKKQLKATGLSFSNATSELDGHNRFKTVQIFK